MKFSTDAFVNNTVAVVVSVIVVSMIALPIISSAIDDLGSDDAQLKTILSIVPIFLVLGILLACIGLFIKGKN